MNAENLTETVPFDGSVVQGHVVSAVADDNLDIPEEFRRTITIQPEAEVGEAGAPDKSTVH